MMNAIKKFYGIFIIVFFSTILTGCSSDPSKDAKERIDKFIDEKILIYSDKSNAADNAERYCETNKKFMISLEGLEGEKLPYVEAEIDFLKMLDVVEREDFVKVNDLGENYRERFYEDLLQ